MTLMLAKNRFGRMVLHMGCAWPRTANGAGIGPAFAVSFVAIAIASIEFDSALESTNLDTLG